MSEGAPHDDRVSRRAFERERAARKESERLLEDKSRELYERNESYRRLNEQLEARVRERTRELEETLRRAQEAEQSKAAFLANMSHEIRTPLTSIIGFAEVLRDHGEIRRDEAQVSDAAGVICLHGDHLLALLNDILDLSKIDSGKLRIERVRCDLLPLMEEAVGLLRRRAEIKGLGLEIEILGKVPESIQTDPTRLRQILINLIGNAVKFTEHGRVLVRVHHKPARGRIRFEVEDSGIGMNEDELAQIRRFETFRQADESTTRQYGGTGLGLAISNALAEELGTGLEISSVLAKGSVFSFEIDTGDLTGVCLGDQASLLHQVAGSTNRDQARFDVSLSGQRVLIVEDGVDNRRLLVHHLSRVGAEVEISENGAEALELLRQDGPRACRFGLVLMDMQMPVLDGYETTRRLRAGGWTVPIVAVTANAMVTDQKLCTDAGCDAVITKPIERERFLWTCAELVGLPKRGAG